MTGGAYVAIAGGVGGARLADGLAQILPPDRLSIIVNTGDDFRHLGLQICPDLDTVMYTLAGLNDPKKGWGAADETWHVMDHVRTMPDIGWFQLGDRDLATHLYRNHLLERHTLTETTRLLAEAVGVRHRLAPMSDQRISTFVDTAEGRLAFQDYFVRRRCEPAFRSLAFDAADGATVSDAARAALSRPDLRAVIICPSNPVLSITPILSTPGMRDAIDAAGAPVVAVSPFIGGEAVKGPAAKIMREIGVETTTEGLTAFYRGLLDGVVIDAQDADAPPPLPYLATDILMRGTADQKRLAAEVLAFADTLAG